MQDLNWNDLRFVLAVARTESLSQAAQRLGVNESTVARRIAQAEQRLDARLFERTLGKLYPTAAGLTVIAGAERIECEILAVENAVSGTDQLIAGAVRLTSVPIIVNQILVPALPHLLGEQPQLKLELIAEPRDLSLSKRETDIALRLARPSGDFRAIARRIGQLDYAVYGRAGTSIEALPWISYEEGMTHLPQARWITEQAISSGEASTRVEVNDADTVLASVRAGLGKSLLPVHVGEQEPNLVRLSVDSTSLSRELWMMVHPELRNLPRIKVVMDWLISIARQLQSGKNLPGQVHISRQNH